MIGDAYRLGAAMGPAVRCTDQAGPSRAIPYPGHSWRPEGDPARSPHESLRAGTAKALALSRPADGHVRLHGVTAGPNAVLHPWLKRQLAEVLAGMPDPPAEPAGGWRAAWGRWQEGLSIRPTRLSGLPPLRMPPVLDDLAGHKAPELVCWLLAHGIMPLSAPAGGSWLTGAESRSGSSSGGRRTASTRATPARSSPGSRRRRGTGIRPRRRPSGAASGRLAGSGSASVVTASAARGHAHVCLSYGRRGPVMATRKPHDPLRRLRRLSIQHSALSTLRSTQHSSNSPRVQGRPKCSS